ncbi:hypothetical protein R3P38DRAFT_3366814 [Favolaschia claudopus]|uniref:Uncharacterized protein n=1 Tax=Favolaschia claudopus TaxID=2862362 RepID=A0AAW0ABZ6_9AGAR
MTDLPLRRSSRQNPTHAEAQSKFNPMPPDPPVVKSKSKTKKSKKAIPQTIPPSEKPVASQSTLKESSAANPTALKTPPIEREPHPTNYPPGTQGSDHGGKDPMRHLLSQVRLPASPARPVVDTTIDNQLNPTPTESGDIEELRFRGNLGTIRTGGLWNNPQVQRTLDAIHEDEREQNESNLKASWHADGLFGRLGLGRSVKLEAQLEAEGSGNRRPSEETLIEGYDQGHDEDWIGGAVSNVDEEEEHFNNRMSPVIEDDDGNDSGDDYVENAVAEERKLAQKGYPTVDEEDADLEKQYIVDIGGKRPDKGKGKANPTISQPRPPSRPAPPPQSVRSSVTLSEHNRNPDPDLSMDQDQEEENDEDEEGPVNTKWPLTTGPVSKNDLDEVIRAREAYHATVESVARRSGKKLSTIFQAAGDNPLATRDINPWNAWEAKYRVEKPRRDHEHPSEFKSRMRAEYKAEFEKLPEEERNDPEARRRLLQPIIDAHLENNTLVLDNRKANGGAQAILSKALRPFINMSTAASHTKDIHVFGVGVDIVHDVAFSWGGSDLYAETKKRHIRPLNAQMNDMKALLQVTNMELRDEAGLDVDEIEVAVQPDWDKRSGEVARDVVRRNVREMFLNAIQLILISRGHSLLEARKIFPKMSWKWCDEAVQHHLRIIDWPNTLKLHYPRPGFNPQQITNKSKSSDDGEGEEQGLTKSLVDMRDAMRRVFEGGNEAASTIVSWTDAEIELDDPRDVPIVVAADGSTLLTARASDALIRKLHKAAKKRRVAAENAEKAAAKAAQHKPARKSNDNDESSGSDDDENSAPPTPVKRSNHIAPSSRANATASSSRVPNAAASSSRGTKRPIQSVDAMEHPAPKRQHHYEDAPTTTWKCRYVYRGRESGTFYAVGMSAYEGNPTPLQDSTYYSAPSGWVKLPQGLQPIVAKEEEGARRLRSMEVGLGL